MEVKKNRLRKDLFSTISVLESRARPKDGASIDREEIPINWQVKTLEDVCVEITDGSHWSPKGNEHNGYKIATVANLKDDHIDIDSCKSVSKSDYVRLSREGDVPRDGDILFSKDGTIGISLSFKQSKDNIAVLSSIAIMRPNHQILDSEFGAQVLKSPHVCAQVLGKKTGSALRRIILSDIRKVVLPVPPLRDQKKIASILSTVDGSIQKTDQIIAKKQQIKRGLMRDLLTRGIDEHGKLRSEETHEFKDSPLGRIPIEWDYGNLGKCCNVHNNLRKPIAELVRKQMVGDYPYYGPTGILDFINEYRVDGKCVLIGEDGDHFLKFNAQEMTLLVNGKFNVNNHAHILSGNEKVVTEWLHLFFMHRDITLYLTRQGAGRLKLNKVALLGLPLAYPKEQAEQKKIVRIVNSVRSNQTETAFSLSKLRSLKIALMQDLLTGKVPITPLLPKAEIGA